MLSIANGPRASGVDFSLPRPIINTFSLSITSNFIRNSLNTLINTSSTFLKLSLSVISSKEIVS